MTLESELYSKLYFNWNHWYTRSSSYLIDVHNNHMQYHILSLNIFYRPQVQFDSEGHRLCCSMYDIVSVLTGILYYTLIFFFFYYTLFFIYFSIFIILFLFMIVMPPTLLYRVCTARILCTVCIHTVI